MYLCLFDLVLDVPLGLLALDAELTSEVDLVACAHLDCPNTKSKYIYYTKII